MIVGKNDVVMILVRTTVKQILIASNFLDHNSTKKYALKHCPAFNILKLSVEKRKVRFNMAVTGRAILT